MSAVPRRTEARAFGPRVMAFLTSQPGPVVFGGFLAWFLGWTVLAAAVFQATVPE